MTEVASISPEDTFGLQSDILEYLADMEQNVKGLGVHKVYASYAEMEADSSAPVGSNGKALRVGQLVAIFDEDNPQGENGNLYVWLGGNNNPSWQQIGNIGSLDNINSRLAALQNAAATLDTKINSTETSIVSLLAGNGPSANANLYPFLNLGNVTSQSDVNTILDTVYTATDMKYNGRMRLTRNGALLLISQHVVNSAEGHWAQCVMGMVTPSADGNSLLQANGFAIVARSTDYNGNATPWRAIGGTQTFKTINGVPITGEGNIQVSPQGSIAIDGIVDPSSENAVSGKGVAKAIKAAKEELTANVLKLGVPFAQQVATADTTYIIRHAYDLGGGTVTIPQGCRLQFEKGGQLNNGTLVGNGTSIDANTESLFGAGMVFSGSWDVKQICPEWFSAKGDALTDDYAAFKTMFSFAECCVSPRIEISRKHKVVASGYNFDLNGNVELVGTSPEASLEIQGGTMQMYNKLGAETPLTANVTADIVKGTDYMSVDDISELAEGDLVTVLDKNDFSYYAERAGYRKGEMKIISAISGTNVYFTEPFLDDYVCSGEYTTTMPEDEATVNTSRLIICKINPITVNIRNLKIIGDGLKGTVRIRGGYNCNVENVVMVGSGIYGINISTSWNTRVDKCTIISAQRPVIDGTAQDSYAISNGNSYYTTISNCKTVSGTHSISNGGGNTAAAVICRYTKVIGCTVDTYNSSMALDFHGNNEFYTVQNNLIYKGMSAGGDHSYILNNTIILPPSEENVMAIWPYRRRGIDIVIESNRIIVNVTVDATALRVIDIAPSFAVTEQGIVRIVDNDVTIVDNRSTQNTAIAVFSFRSSLVESIQIEGNNVAVRADNAPVIYAVSAIYYNKLRIVNNNFDGGLAIRENLDTLVQNNVLGKTSLYGITISSYVSTTEEEQGSKSAHTLIADNIIRDCGSYAIYERYATHPDIVNVEILRNIFGQVGANQEIYIDCAVGSFVVEGNKCLGSKKAIYLACLSVVQSGNNFNTITSPKWNRGKGTTAQRPTMSIAGGGLQPSDVGFTYFDTDLLKQIFFAAKMAATVTKNYFAAAYSSVFDTNVLQSDTVYGIIVNRTGQRQLWASKVNDAFSEGNAVLLYDTSVDGDKGYIYAPDATVYPYVYMTNPASGSVCRFEIYAIDDMWVDAMGENPDTPST